MVHCTTTNQYNIELKHYFGTEGKFHDKNPTFQDNKDNARYSRTNREIQGCVQTLRIQSIKLKYPE